MPQIKDYNYTITKTGLIKNCKTKKKVTSYIATNGYVRVRLQKNGERHNYALHRLVAETFIPNPNQYPEVNHIDGNKLNNHVSNLEWCTRSQNMKHVWATGLRKKSKKRCNI